MATQIHLVRHAESTHNVSKDFSERDPPLTEIGVKQASELVSSFPHSQSIGLVITSPLKRAVRTALAAFLHVLDKSNYLPGSSSAGISNGAKLIVDPDLQEKSDLPCDTGSDRPTLETTFPGVNFGTLDQSWHLKEGAYSAVDEIVEARAARFRTRLVQLVKELRNERKKDIVVVTHGVFMKVLSGDPSIDLPKAGWRSYTIIQDDVNGHSNLVPVV